MWKKFSKLTVLRTHTYGCWVTSSQLRLPSSGRRSCCRPSTWWRRDSRLLGRRSTPLCGKRWGRSQWRKALEDSIEGFSPLSWGISRGVGCSSRSIARSTRCTKQFITPQQRRARPVFSSMARYLVASLLLLCTLWIICELGIRERN